jgi:N-acyl amino acid synthase of PEP-CTERM/exosortase system
LENNRDSYSKNLAEVSRLCLVKEIRRRKKEHLQTPYGHAGIGIGIGDEKFKSTNVKTFYSQRQLRQSILFGLVHASAQYCVENDINDWFWLGTDALAKILRKSGLNISKVGDACQHRGERFPFKVSPAQTLSALESGYAKSFILYSELKNTDSELFQASA